MDRTDVQEERSDDELESLRVADLVVVQRIGLDDVEPGEREVVNVRSGHGHRAATHRFSCPGPSASRKYSCLGNVRLRSRPMLFSCEDVCLRRVE